MEEEEKEEEVGEEEDEQKRQRQEDQQQQHRNHNNVVLCLAGSQMEAVQEVEEVCPHFHQEEVTVEISYPWSFIDALYFSMTVTTTIG